MNEYDVIIHYVVPSRHGGIESAIQRFSISAINEDKAEQAAINQGVNDPNYLYTNMVEVNRTFA